MTTLAIYDMRLYRGTYLLLIFQTQNKWRSESKNILTTALTMIESPI
nr:MAG TPA: hypothetical protein [Caudoviricetes sp.]DAQ57630.1 MAG TPA: hypothetical protein [Caudoviricetes sp.]